MSGLLGKAISPAALMNPYKKEKLGKIISASASSGD
jgi:hypothetical protein